MTYCYKKCTCNRISKTISSAGDNEKKKQDDICKTRLI